MQGLYRTDNLIICLLLLLLGGTSTAQDQLGPVSDSYAITNVTIIPGPGRIIEKGAIVIKDGLIQAVGANVAIPPEAIIMNADSMFAYAGFIDGLSHTGVEKPKDDNHERPKDPGNPPPSVAGINPQNDVRNFLDPDDRSVREMRCAGFCAAHVVPHGIVLPGTGAVVLLGGKTPDDMVLEANHSLYAELTWNRTIYPSTIMGLFATWRQLYRRAGLARDYDIVYASGSKGLHRPTSDRVLHAFYPVIQKQMPVCFKAEKVVDLHHVIALQQELGFRMVLAEVRQGWDLIDKIKASGYKVFLSMDLPEEKKKDNGNSTEPKKDSADVDPEIAALKIRQAEFIQKLVSQASTFYRAGVRFGFSAMDVKPGNIHRNLMRMIDADLPEDVALAALTLYPAEILGIDDRLGTLDQGKIANIVVFSKSFFDKDAKLKLVFVDGVLYPCEEKIPKKNGPKTAGLEGAWSMVTETPHGKTDLKIVFTRTSKDQLGGSIRGGKLPEPIELSSVTVTGKGVRFVYSVTFEGTRYEVTVDGTVEGKTFSGNMVVGEYGPFPINGVKDPKP